MSYVPPEYQMISEFYLDKKAERSGLPYMKHIDDGLAHLAYRGHGRYSRVARAFMIHPIVQSDKDLAQSLDLLHVLDGSVVALAMEYRAVANGYLSSDYRAPWDDVRISCIPEVNEMLIADKMQNLGDLEMHNKDHPRFEELRHYFNNWLRALGVEEPEQ